MKHQLELHDLGLVWFAGATWWWTVRCFHLPVWAGVRCCFSNLAAVSGESKGLPAAVVFSIKKSSKYSHHASMTNGFKAFRFEFVLIDRLYAQSSSSRFSSHWYFSLILYRMIVLLLLLNFSVAIIYTDTNSYASMWWIEYYKVLAANNNSIELSLSLLPEQTLHWLYYTFR